MNMPNPVPHFDHTPYFRYTKPQRVDKAIHTLEGLLKGIAIDGLILPAECRELTNWCDDQRDLIGQHPFSEIVPMVQTALTDGAINAEEQADILWLCKNLSSGSNYFDQVTTDVQILHGILHGILADGVITDEETKGLREWMDSNMHLQGIYPFDELDSLLTTVLRDGHVGPEDQSLLQEFFQEFISYSLSKRIEKARTNAALKKQMRLPGVCATCPVIEFPEKKFCFTGASTRALRCEIAKQVVCRRGLFKDTVSAELDYLVIGAAGNPCWAFSCYGRKVEQAVTLRREGHRLTIVHENDFWDAIQDTKDSETESVNV